MSGFKRVDLKDNVEIRQKAKILIVTATPVETAALHAVLLPLPPFRKCLEITLGAQTFFVGRIGKHGVIHVQCQMGSVTTGGSSVTVSQALNLWDIVAVIMVGIGFGVDEESQKIGDVLISKSIQQYEIQRVGKKQTIQRGAQPPAGATLLNRFTNSRGWKFNISKKRLATVKPVQILSGEKLIDNIKFRKRLTKQFPDAGGGEMEGAGVVSAAHEKNIEWIIVKAVCDFADGNKARGKKAKQRKAAAAAISYCAHVLSKDGCLDSLGCPDVTTGANRSRNLLGMEIALFEIYEEKAEPAYFHRTIDDSVQTDLTQQGLWISGPSGSGKTTCLMRNVLVGRRKCFFIDLSRCVGSTVVEIFATLYEEIRGAIGDKHNAIQQTTEHDLAFWIDQIIEVVEKQAPQGTYIFVDEIPLANVDDFRKFADGVTAIIISLANKNIRTTRFILSSIEDAKPHLKEFQKKVHHHVRFRHLANWSQSEIAGLLKLILGRVKVTFKTEEKAKMLQAADGCPRRLKRILKLAITHKGDSDWPLERILAESCCC